MSRESVRETEFARNLDRMSRSAQRDPTNVTVYEEKVVRGDRGKRIVPMCSNMVLLVAVAVPLLVWAWLWFATPRWWQVEQNGVLVRDNKKIAITVIIVAVIAAAMVMLSNGGWSSCS